VRHRPLTWVSEERLGNLRAAVAITLAPTVLRHGPFRPIRVLELVIARGVPEEVLDYRRGIVRRRTIVPDDALTVDELESRLELQTRHTVDVHGHQMQACRRHLQRQSLKPAAITSGEQRRLPSGFRKVIDRADAEGRSARNWTNVLGANSCARRNGMNGDVHDSSLL